MCTMRRRTEKGPKNDEERGEDKGELEGNVSIT